MPWTVTKELRGTSGASAVRHPEGRLRHHARLAVWRQQRNQLVMCISGILVGHVDQVRRRTRHRCRQASRRRSQASCPAGQAEEGVAVGVEEGVGDPEVVAYAEAQHAAHEAALEAAHAPHAA